MEFTNIMKKLNGFVSPSANEKELLCCVKDMISAYIPEEDITFDTLGNLIAVMGKGCGKKVMFSAHADTIGVIAHNIDEKGFVKVSALGGLNPKTLSGRHIRFTNGINGLMNFEEGILEIGKAYIDIGAKSKEEAMEYVRLGDSVWFESAFVEFGDGFIKAKALDDRAGCAILIEMIKGELEYDMWFSFSVQEEIGTRGAQTAAFTIAPDYAIAVETTTAADISGVKDEKRVCICGKGGTVSFMDRSTLYSKELFDKAFEIAERENIPCQPKTVVAGGNDSGVIHKSRGGVKVLTVSIPCRYLHSPSCVIKYNDAKESLRLIKALAEDFAEC